MNQFTIKPMTKMHAWEISNWKYDGIYSFYNCPTTSKPTVDGDTLINNSFVAYDNHGTLIGHFHFGSDAWIPTIENFNYSSDYLDIGLGLHPELCGLGYGVQFITFVIEFAKQQYNSKKFRLSVAAFNERAQKVYEKVGFSKTCEVTNSYFKNKFYIMILE